MPTSIRAFCLVAALLAPAAFADYEAHVFGGASFVSGDISDYATDGYTFGFGGTSDDGGALAWRWDLGFDFHDAREGAFNSRYVDNGNLNTTYLRFGPQWKFEGYETSFYVNAMAGYYWTYGYISQYATVPGYICDPFWGYCWLVPVAGEVILADFHEDDWGVSATAGMEFDVVGGKWFIELQYHSANQGQGIEFAPLVVGLRW